METNKQSEEKTVQYNKSMSSNPVTSSIIARMNSLNAKASKSNRLYGGYNTKVVAKTTENIDYYDIIQSINFALKDKFDVNEFYLAIHDIISNRLNCQFSALGIFHKQSKCFNLKLTDKIGGAYSARIFLSDTENPIIESFNTKTPKIIKNTEFLNLSYLKDTKVGILPLMSVNNCIGIMLVGEDNIEKNFALYQLLASHTALFMHNAELIEKATEHTNTDTLTSLSNHRGFQELLSTALAKAEKATEPLSIVMMDVNNISKINRELGHAKGDEIIKLVAEKVKQNIRGNDFAGRYGGDEIVIALPKTDASEAKYIAEYLTYSLSCCFVDDVGPVKVAVGISTFPDCTHDQEKLLIQAEQAMFISQSKGYKDGMSAIISSSDYDFWDDMALSSFAEVLTKRHAQLGVNFEEELVHKFNSEKIKNQSHLMEMVTSLAGAIDAKDPYTKGHSTSVSRYAEALARAINLPEEEVERITLGALLHDVGKIGIPENVLKKPTHLSDEEWEIMKQHPVIGAEKVLMPNDALRDLIPMVKYHHEHWDGSGYPSKLKGEEIPLEARIVAVADAYHALVSDRPYRKGMSVEKACEILRMGSDIQWDRTLVRQFIQIAPSLSTTV